MTDKNNPFGGFDFANIMKQMQDNPVTKSWQDNDYVQSIAKMFGQDDEPMDFGELWEMQKKNLQTLNEANMGMGERMATLAKQQSELMKEAWETVQHYSEEAMKGKVPDAPEQMKAAQSVFEKAMKNMQDLGSQGLEMTGEASESLQKRMTESVGELEKLMKKYTK